MEFLSLGAVKNAIDLAKAAFDADRKLHVQQHLLDAQNKIFEAQSKIADVLRREAALIEENASLKSRIAESARWDEISSRYSLTDFGGETFAYVLKAEPDETAHKACPACFLRQRISILQANDSPNVPSRRYRCLDCNSNLRLGPPGQQRRRSGGSHSGIRW